MNPVNSRGTIASESMFNQISAVVGSLLLTGALAGSGVHTALLAVTIGNSINAGANNGTARNPSGYWASGSDIHTANMFAGSPLRWDRITATTRSDAWGNYAYSGQTLDTIQADLPAQLWTPLVTASVIPQIIIFQSSLENDIATNGLTYDIIKRRVDSMIAEARGRYPGARQWWICPRPSNSYDTPLKVAIYQQIIGYLNSLDNSSDFFVSNANAYENPASPGTPLPGYTDALVHPNTLGGMVLGRSYVPDLKRICKAALQPYRCVSLNFGLQGSGAVGAVTNVTGTVPTGVVQATTANGTIVMTALQPGCTLAATQAAGANVDMSTVNFGATAVSGGTKYSPYVILRIDSGAADIRLIAMQPRMTDGTTAPFYNFQGGASSDADGDYRNGDYLTIRCPPLMQADGALAGAITSFTTHIRMTRKTGGSGGNALTGGTIQLTLIDSGVGIVA